MKTMSRLGYLGSGSFALLMTVGLVIAASCAPPELGARGSSSGASNKEDGGGSEDVEPTGTFTKGKSCTGGVGADTKCGGGDQGEGSTDCCDVKKIPGGTFNRFNDSAFPATVSPFALDTFEVTAGRFRTWVTATNGNLRSSAPAAGAGAHPKIPNSGWRTEWNKYLPSSNAEVDIMFGSEDTANGFLTCQFGTDPDNYGALTWWTSALESRIKSRNRGNSGVLAENTKDALDRKPLNCVPWHVLFAFCAWDGGRLPTDAEWSFAQSGGSEQRAFPWGNVDPTNLAPIGADRSDLSLVPVFDFGSKYVSGRLYDKTLGENEFEDNYSFTYGGKMMGKKDGASHIPPVGSKPLGNGKWGNADLGGGMFEWMLDEGPIRPGDCKDCANVSWPSVDARDPNAYMKQEPFQNQGGVDWFKGGTRSIRGSAWDNAQGLAAKQEPVEIEFFTSYPVLRSYRSLGGRCARDLK